MKKSARPAASKASGERGKPEAAAGAAGTGKPGSKSGAAAPLSKVRLRWLAPLEIKDFTSVLKSTFVLAGEEQR